MTRSALIRDAARNPRDEGTRWRDRLERWLVAIEPPLPVAYRWHNMSFGSYVSKELAALLKDVPQITAKEYHDAKNAILGK